jgi:hypothetical protein
LVRSSNATVADVVRQENIFVSIFDKVARCICISQLDGWTFLAMSAADLVTRSPRITLMPPPSDEPSLERR